MIRALRKFFLSSTLALVGMTVVLGMLPRGGVDHAGGVTAASPVPGLRVLQSDPGGIVLELSAPDYHLALDHLSAGIYQRLTMDGFTSTSEPGKPQVPHMVAMVGIPPDARLAVRVLSDDAQLLPGRFNLSPVPSPAPLKNDLQPGELRYELDAAAYATDALYPSSAARVLDTAWLRDQRIARIELAPIQYNPAQAAIVWHRRLVIEVRFDRTAASTHPADRSQPGPFDSILRHALLNYDVAKAWRDDGAIQSSSPRTYPITDTTPRYKIVVDRDGLYRVRYADLQAAGMSVDTIDPRTFHLTSQGYDVAIEVAGEEDGHFNSGDYLLFYGQKLRGDIIAARHVTESLNYILYPNDWQPHFNATMVEKYTDENVYWLTVGGAPGPRIATTDGTPDGFAPTPATYTATVHAEQQKVWWSWSFTSEDTWFWDSLQTSSILTRTYTTTLTGVANGDFTATVRAEVSARNFNVGDAPDHRTQFRLNVISPALEDAYWDNATRHRLVTGTAQANLLEGTNYFTLTTIRQPPLAATGEWLYFDWFEIEYARHFQAVNDQLLFSHQASGPRQYVITNFVTSTLHVLDVADPFMPQRVLSSTVAAGGGSYTATFEVSATAPVTFFVAGADTITGVKRIERYVPPDLSAAGGNGADYIIITHRNFYTAVQTLANYRSAQGLRVKVIDVADLYNQFGGGIYHPIAIKDFLAYAYANWPPPAPSYVLLVGDGHWNLKGFPAYAPAPIYMPPNLAFVDPYQGEVDSANLLVTIVGADPLPDMMIGRLPVNTITDTNVAITKIISYEHQTPPSAWQDRMTFVADNVPDPNGAGDFVAMSNNVIQTLLPPGLVADRIYENDYGCVDSQVCPAVNTAIVNTLNMTGALFVNYIGHASLNRWSHEQVFINSNVPALTNINQLPIILSLTCLDGYWFHPSISGLMEDMIRAANGGAVTTFSPTGLGVASGHDTLERGFLTAVFQDGEQTIGPATIAGKLALYATHSNYDLLNTFTIFGDPALRLATYAISLTPASDAKSGTPASPAVYTLQAANQAYLTDTLTLSADGNGWAISLPSSRIVPAGQGTNFNVTVTVPITAALGATDQVTLTVASHGNAARAIAVLTTTAGAYYSVTLASTPAINSGLPDSVVTYTARVTNTGNTADTFDLARSGNSWPTGLSISNVTLPAGGSSALTVAVTVPGSALAGSSDGVTVQVTARGNGAFATTRLTTIADALYGVSLTPATLHQIGDVGRTVTSTLRLTNTGNIASVFVITGSGVWPTNIEPTGIGPIGVGAGVNVAIGVSIPLNTLLLSDTATITATAQGGNWPTVTSRLITAASVHRLFLPLVVKSS